MAFPTVQSITETNNSFVSTHSFDLPATINAGDLLLLIVGISDNSENATTPTDWTKLDETNGTSRDIVIFYKIADGDEDGGSVSLDTDTSEDTSGQVYRITGWNGTASGIEAGTGVTDDTQTDDSPDPPSLNPSGWGTEDTLWIAVCTHDPTDSVSSYPTNYTNGTDTKSGDLGSDSRIATARRENNTASEDPGVFTMSDGAAWIAQTIAIRTGAGEQTLDPPLVSVSPTFYGPTFAPGSVSLDPPLVSLTPTIYGPSLAAGLSPPLVDISPSVFGPTFVPGSVNLQPPVVSISPTFYDPTFAATYSLTAPLVSVPQTIYSPSLQFNQNVTMPLVDASPTIYGPIMFKIWKDTDSLASPTWSDVDVTP